MSKMSAMKFPFFALYIYIYVCVCVCVCVFCTFNQGDSMVKQGNICTIHDTVSALAFQSNNWHFFKDYLQRTLHINHLKPRGNGIYHFL